MLGHGVRQNGIRLGNAGRQLRQLLGGQRGPAGCKGILSAHGPEAVQKIPVAVFIIHGIQYRIVIGDGVIFFPAAVIILQENQKLGSVYKQGVVGRGCL